MKHLFALLLTLATTAAFAQDKQPQQCNGKTKQGQCERIAKVEAKDGKQYCAYHNPDRPHCTGKTSKGEPCKAYPLKGGNGKCSAHYFQKDGK